MLGSRDIGILSLLGAYSRGITFIYYILMKTNFVCTTKGMTFNASGQQDWESIACGEFIMKMMPSGNWDGLIYLSTLGYRA